MMIHYRLSAFALLLSCLTLPGCNGQVQSSLASLSNASNGGTRVLSGDVLPDSVVDAVSVWLFDAQKDKLKKEGKISQDPRYVETVTRVFEQVKQAAAKSKYGDRAKALDWEVLVVDDDQTEDATGSPGGKIVVYTGLFDLVNNEAALAAVLGHEMTHVLARHANQRITRDMIASLPIAAILAGTAANPEDLDPKVTAPVMVALGLGVFEGVDRPFSRELESEADDQGMLLASSAGYDPEEALNFWINLDEHPDAVFYGAHPGSGQRIADLNARMEAFRVAYDRADSKHPEALLAAVATR
jgi:predicted Zn-dependent protease